MLLQIRRHTTPHYAQTDESNFHFHSFPHVAVANSGSLTFFPSIFAISSSVRRSSAAPTFPSTCFALRAPTIAPVTAGFRSVHDGDLSRGTSAAFANFAQVLHEGVRAHSLGWATRRRQTDLMTLML